MKRRTFLKWAIATPVLGVATFTETEVKAEPMMSLDFGHRTDPVVGSLWCDRENGGIWVYDGKSWVLPQVP